MYSTISCTLKNIEDKIEILGRTRFENGALNLSWSASGFVMRFVGEAIAFSFLPYCSTAAPTASDDQRYIAVKMVIDGTATKATVSGSHSVVFADGLSPTEHTLRFYKLTESDEPLRVSEVQIYGEAPEVLEYKSHHSFKMEVVGDSITCGYGVWGTRPAFAPFEEDPTAAYAHLAAEYYNAELRLISWSGMGLNKSYSGEEANRFHEFFARSERVSGEHDFSTWTPDIVVVNGGTNDANSLAVSDVEFEESTENFYRFLRLVYPRAKILFFYGAMGDRYDAVYRCLADRLREGDDGVYYRRAEAIDPAAGELGAIGHPSAKCQRRLADELIRAIGEIFALK